MLAKILLVRFRVSVLRARALVVDGGGVYTHDVETVDGVHAQLNVAAFDLVIADVRSELELPFGLIEQLRRADPLMPIVLIAPRISIGQIVRAIRLGVRDVIPPPVELTALVARMEELLRERGKRLPSGANHAKWSELAVFLAGQSAEGGQSRPTMESDAPGRSEIRNQFVGSTGSSALPVPALAAPGPDAAPLAGVPGLSSDDAPLEKAAFAAQRADFEAMRAAWETERARQEEAFAIRRVQQANERDEIESFREQQAVLSRQVLELRHQLATAGQHAAASRDVEAARKEALEGELADRKHACEELQRRLMYAESELAREREALTSLRDQLLVNIDPVPGAAVSTLPEVAEAAALRLKARLQALEEKESELRDAAERLDARQQRLASAEQAFAAERAKLEAETVLFADRLAEFAAQYRRFNEGSRMVFVQP